MFFDKILTKIFGTANERLIKRLMPMVASISALEPEIKQLTDEQLRAKTVEFRARIAARLEGITDDRTRCKAAEKEALDEILPEAFAVVREAGWRAVQMRHFDVQLIGGMVLHQGKIAEMKTGEGKTLVATLACYLNALAGHGVHVVTVNDYLAKRDAEWMGKIYEFLGLTVGVIVHDLDDNERRAAYACRHHLRNQQRVRLRLPARQHEVRDQGLRAARALLRDRRRGGLDPDRRGADAADHLRPDGPDDGQVRAGAEDHSAAGAGRRDRMRATTSARQELGIRAGRGREVPDRRLHCGREAADDRRDRRGLGDDREGCWASATSPTRRTGN